MVIVCELSPWQELVPVILFVTCEDIDKLFEFLVDVFGLAVSLWVVSGQSSRLNTDEAPQLLGELHDEL